MASWFSSLAEQAFKLADELADTIVAQANEAQAQIQAEQKKLEAEETQKKERMFGTHLLLPWETDVESRQILSQDLMEKVLTLPLQEGNFNTKAPNSNEVYFSFQDFIPVAMKLLEIDSNLARVHAKLSPKMNEEDFWFNYYCRIVFLRAWSGIDGVEAQNAVKKWKESEMLVYNVVSSHSQRPSTSPVSKKTNNGSSSQSPPTAKAVDNSFDTINMNTPAKMSTISSVSPLPDSENKSHPGNDELDDLDLELEENLKDLDLLDELDDIDPDDYEKIGGSELNDELEAQIALELAEDDL
jgi:hypothetical protein